MIDEETLQMLERVHHSMELSGRDMSAQKELVAVYRWARDHGIPALNYYGLKHLKSQRNYGGPSNKVFYEYGDNARIALEALPKNIADCNLKSLSEPECGAV